MRGRLNLFQSTMLRWRALYPYNAVHLVEVGGPLQPARLELRLKTHLETAGLTGLIVDWRARKFA